MNFGLTLFHCFVTIKLCAARLRTPMKTMWLKTFIKYALYFLYLLDIRRKNQQIFLLAQSYDSYVLTPLNQQFVT